MLALAVSLPFKRNAPRGGGSDKLVNRATSTGWLRAPRLPVYMLYLALFGVTVAAIVLLLLWAHRRWSFSKSPAAATKRGENGSSGTHAKPAVAGSPSFLASIGRLFTPSKPPDRELSFRSASAAKPKAVVTPSAKKKATDLDGFVKRLFKEGMPVLKIKAGASVPHRKEKVLRIDDKAVLYFEATGFNWLTGKDKKSVWSAHQLKSVVDGDAGKWELFVEFSEKQGVSILHVAALSSSDYDDLKLGMQQLLGQMKSHPQYVVKLLAGLTSRKVVEARPISSPDAAATSAPASTAAPSSGAAPATPSSSLSKATPAVTPASTPARAPAPSIFSSLFSPSKAKPLVPKPAEPLASLSTTALKELVVQNGLSDLAVNFLEKQEFVKLLESHYAK